MKREPMAGEGKGGGEPHRGIPSFFRRKTIFGPLR